METGRSTLDQEMNIPQDFRCPISMELMNEPVIISTGVTYERKNIEKWFFTYKKTTCPATMQTLDDLGLTPNHTLKRLILAWIHSHSPSSSPSPSSWSTPPSSSSSSLQLSKQDEIASTLKTLESTPFKVSSLRKLGCLLQMGYEMKLDFILIGGLEVLLQIIAQNLDNSLDFEAFRACEEALGILQQVLILQEDCKIIEKISNPKCMKSMVIVLQRGSTQSRLHTVLIFLKLAKSDFNWNTMLNHLDVNLFKSLLEFISDEICTKESSMVLQILIKILDSSKRSRLKAIEAGAICTLIELLPDSNRSRCEKILQIIKLLCECADGRLAFIKHRLGIGAISKKLLNVSEIASKICVKIFWLICSFHPTDIVLEEMMIYGVVKKLVVMLHMSGSSSTKDKATQMLKNHGILWRHHPCFPSELKDNYSSMIIHVQNEHVNT